MFILVSGDSKFILAGLAGEEKPYSIGGKICAGEEIHLLKKANPAGKRKTCFRKK